VLKLATFVVFLAPTSRLKVIRTTNAFYWYWIFSLNNFYPENSCAHHFRCSFHLEFSQTISFTSYLAYSTS